MLVAAALRRHSLSSLPVFVQRWLMRHGEATRPRRVLGLPCPNASLCCCLLRGSCSGAYALEVGRLVVHSSDSVGAAEKEIDLWFPEGIVAGDYVPCHLSWTQE